MEGWKIPNSNRPQGMFALALSVTLTIATAALTGCGGGKSDTPQAIEPAPAIKGLLIPAGSSNAFTDSIASGFTTLSSPDNQIDVANIFNRDGLVLRVGPITAPIATPITPVSELGSDAQSTYSATYTQEADVDEFDAVKYDGERLFVAPRLGCCNSATPIALDFFAPGIEPAPDTRAIRILVTDPDNAGATETARIDLADNISVQGMFLHNNRLAALTSEQYFGGWGGLWITDTPWQNQQNGVVLYDVTNSASPEKLWEASLDGSLIDSRRVDDTIYLFTRYSPFLNDLVFRPDTEEQRQVNEDLIAGADSDLFLPKIRINGQEQILIDPANCLITNTSNDAAGRSPENQTNGAASTVAPASTPVLTLITAININSPDNLQTLCYNESAYGLYASSTSVYLSQLLFGNEPNSEQTRIHKFALKELEYQGSAEVPGLLWSGGQRDFRASEHNGDLRVVTSRSSNDPDDRIDHELHILRLAEDRPELEIIASLPNTAQPDEIGKPNESLYGVRFFGERAYAVTFLQTDPLYVFDLANPLEPRITGELEVTGFSDFLHPVNANLLLGFGTGEDRALKLELFDVSDLSAPRSLAVERLGGPFSYSEARYDRHAFTYLPNVTRGDVTLDRFAIPADIYDQDAEFNWIESGLYLYEIGNTDTPAAATLSSAGAMVFDTPTPERLWPIGGRYRSIFDKDAVYLIRNQDVFSAFWDSADSVNGPL